MHALEAQAISKGVKHIRLNSASHRTGAHAFYQSIGYDCYKTQKAFSKNLWLQKIPLYHIWYNGIFTLVEGLNRCIINAVAVYRP